MRDTTIRDSATTGIGGSWLLPVFALGLVASAAAVLGPDRVGPLVVGLIALVVVALRPQLGVAMILILLLVQYGHQGRIAGARTGLGELVTVLVPAGKGLLTVNNVLGILLALLVTFRIYRTADWSFLRSPQLKLVILITLMLVFSGYINQVDYREQEALHLRIRGQDPMRLMASRAMFLVYFTCFIRRPKDLWLMVGVFLALSLITAFDGLSAALAGSGYRPGIAGYRAGGQGALMVAAGNPNRLALSCTLAIVLIFEYSNAQPRQRRWPLNLLIALLALTILMTGSRGGLLGLTATAAMFLGRQREGMRKGVSRLMILVVGVVVLGQFIPVEIRERLTNIPGLTEDTTGEGTGSLERRQYTYGIGLRIWSSAPVLGVGLGNWSFERFTTDPLRSASVPHNSYLKALAEGGVVTLALYLALFAVTIRQLAGLEKHPEVMQRAREEGLGWLIGATRISLMSFLVFSLFADLWELIFFYLLIGMAGVLIQRYQAEAARPLPAEAY